MTVIEHMLGPFRVSRRLRKCRGAAQLQWYAKQHAARFAIRYVAEVREELGLPERAEPPFHRPRISLHEEAW